jgi:PKD repeat protein
MIKPYITFAFTLAAGVISLSAQSVSTVAGIQYKDSGKFNSTASNPVAQEYYSRPCGIAVDTNNRVYISDEHNIMLIDGSTSRNRGGFRGDPYSSQALGNTDGTGLVSRFTYPAGMAVHPNSQDVWVADRYNCLIRKGTRFVNSSNEASWTTQAGSPSFLGGYVDGPVADAAFASPEDIVFTKKGVIFVCDTDNHCIRKILSGQVSTLAGDGSQGKGYQDGTGKAARFSYPMGIAMEDNDTFLLVADRNNKCIRRVNTFTGATTTLVSNLNYPTDVIQLDGNIFIVEATCIKMFNGKTTSIYAGHATESGYVNGPVLDARFGQIIHVDFRKAEKSMYVPDFGNNVIRKVPLLLTVKADFVASTTSPIVNQTVKITSTSENETSLLWEISPNTYTLQAGSKLTDKEIYVSFNSATSYTVKLTGSNLASTDVETKSNYITVSTNSVGAPIADFTANDLIPIINQTVTLIDLSSNNPTSYKWTISPATYTLANGSTLNDRNPQVKFTSVGLYNVSLEVTNTNGSNKKDKNSMIQVVLTSQNDIKSTAIKYWPNPTRNTVNFSELPQGSIVYLYDQTGKLCKVLNSMESEINEFELNLPSGMYFVLLNSNNTNTQLGKLIIE